MSKLEAWVVRRKDTGEFYNGEGYHYTGGAAGRGGVKVRWTRKSPFYYRTLSGANGKKRFLERAEVGGEGGLEVIKMAILPDSEVDSYPSAHLSADVPARVRSLLYKLYKGITACGHSIDYFVHLDTDNEDYLKQLVMEHENYLNATHYKRMAEIQKKVDEIESLMKSMDKADVGILAALKDGLREASPVLA